MNSARRRLALAAAALLAHGSARAFDSLEPAVQATLILRVLTFDRSFRRNAPAQAKLALVQAPSSPEGDALCRPLGEALSALVKTGGRAAGKELTGVALPFTSRDALSAQLKASAAAAIYVCPGLNPGALASIRAVAREQSLLTLTGNESYGWEGASLLLARGDGKVKLVLDLQAAKAEGAELESGLLNLAQFRGGKDAQ